MPAPRDGATALRRFSAIWALSFGIKLAAVALLVVLVLKFEGGL